MNATNNTHSIVVGYVAWAFGVFGAHRFYYGKPLTGLLWMFTLGLLFIGWIVDLFLIPSMDAECNARFKSGPIDYTIAWLLTVFLGYLGIHRFYMGKWVTGLIWLVTAGLMGFGWIYDCLTYCWQVDEVNRELTAH
ncbi:NINE protein [bacterium]|nr:NINE protein [bacterium]